MYKRNSNYLRSLSSTILSNCTPEDQPMGSNAVFLAMTNRGHPNTWNKPFLLQYVHCQQIWSQTIIQTAVRLRSVVNLDALELKRNNRLERKEHLKYCYQEKSRYQNKAIKPNSMHKYNFIAKWRVV